MPRAGSVAVAPLVFPIVWRQRAALQRFVLGVPFFGLHERTHHEIAVQLASRPAHAIADAWQQAGHSWPRVAPILRCVQGALRWPTPHLVPDDPVEVVLFDPRSTSPPDGVRAHIAMLERRAGVTLPAHVLDGSDDAGALRLGHLLRALGR